VALHVPGWYDGSVARLLPSGEAASTPTHAALADVVVTEAIGWVQAPSA
jgi:hypothetical protein